MKRAMTPLLLATLLSGCTFEDGVGFAHLSGSLHSSFAGLLPGSGRLQADGWYKADNSFELKLTSLTLEVRDVRLQSSTTSSAAASGTCTFDPSNPPAGCSLCHGGHCHCDGKLVSYEVLKQQACGGSSGGTTIATVGALQVGKEYSLLGAGTASGALTCSGSCELKRGSASQVSVLLDGLEMTAKVQDRSLADRLSGKTLDVTVDLSLAGAALVHKFTAAQGLDRDNEYMFDLAVKLPVTDKLLDGIEWHKLTPAAGAITINATTNKSAGETIATSLAKTALQVTVSRDE